VGLEKQQIDTTVLTTAADTIRRATENQHPAALLHLCGDVSRYGSTDVQIAFADLCDRWTNGLTILTKDATTISDALNQAASGYRLAEETTNQRFAGAATRPQ
jgi:hypothetical protein